MIAGIDPGATGAIAFLEDGQLLDVQDMPYMDGHVSAPILASILNDDRMQRAYIERAQSMPNQGIASSFKYGVGYGTILGVLGALHIPIHTIRPAVWKKAAGLTNDKGASRRRAIELWPSHSHMFARAKDDGRAEAALIALHGHQQHPEAT